MILNNNLLAKYHSLKTNLIIYGLDSFRKYDLCIFNNVFPWRYSAFSLVEFRELLKYFKNSCAFATGDYFKGDKESYDRYLMQVSSFKESYPELANKVHLRYKIGRVKSKLLYSIFLNDTYNYVLPISAREKIPFCFTLYPGGGFQLYDSESDKKLKDIFRCKYFKKVLVTQKCTYDYLVENNFCDKNDIVFNFGVVIENKPTSEIHKYFESDKSTLDIAFAANRYTTYGKDKGFDVFIAVAKKITSKYKNVNFHIVGPWENVYDTSKFKNIYYYGMLDYDAFPKFYVDKDIIISPNAANILNRGSFDGFPTGCCLDASTNGLLMMLTDPLNLNDGYYKDGIDYMKITNNINDITDKIEDIINNPSLLQKIAKSGQNRSNKIFSFQSQIVPRINFISDILNNI